MWGMVLGYVRKQVEKIKNSMDGKNVDTVLMELGIPMVLHLFDTLHALCNLLVVAPDNLKQVCSGEQLANLDKNILHSFVQLRADYRSARLARHFS